MGEGRPDSAAAVRHLVRTSLFGVVQGATGCSGKGKTIAKNIGDGLFFYILFLIVILSEAKDLLVKADY